MLTRPSRQILNNLVDQSETAHTKVTRVFRNRLRLLHYDLCRLHPIHRFHRIVPHSVSFQHRLSISSRGGWIGEEHALMQKKQGGS